MQKYEYTCILNEYAQAGWELVCTDKNNLYFKREIDNKRSE